MNGEPIQLFEEAFSCFFVVIRSVPGDLFLAPLNGWSSRDIVAHLVGWNRLMIASCQDILQGKTPYYYSCAEDDYREINDRFVALYASTDREALLGDLSSSKQELVSYLNTVSPAEWEADHGVVHHRGGSSTVARLLASLEGDYCHHTSQIKTWLRQVGVEFAGSQGS